MNTHETPHNCEIVSHAQLIQSLEWCYLDRDQEKARATPLIIGEAGHGKTTAIKHLAKRLGEKLGMPGPLDTYVLDGGTCEVADVRGAMVVTQTPKLDPKTEEPLEDKEDRTTFALPTWLPTHGKGILFLDEITNAPSDVRNALMNIVIFGGSGDYKVPQGWMVVAAGNVGGNYTVHELNSPAQIDRLQIFKLEVTKNQFLEYYKGSPDYNRDIAKLVASKSDAFLFDRESADNAKSFTSPRSIEAVGRFLNCRRKNKDNLKDPDTFELIYKNIAGMVGRSNANIICEYIKNSDSQVSVEDILYSYDSVREILLDSMTDLSGNISDYISATVGGFWERLQHKDSAEEKELIYPNLKGFIDDISDYEQLLCLFLTNAMKIRDQLPSQKKKVFAEILYELAEANPKFCDQVNKIIDTKRDAEFGTRV